MENELRIGVFGAWRGRTYMKALHYIDGARVTAVCEKKESRLEKAKADVDEDCAFYTDFDEFISSGKFDAVILANYFNEHATYAIKALEHGIHVFSETMAASTLADCVRLCRAVEKSGLVYMMAENYPYTRGCLEMKRLYDSGTLGEVRFAEGEYEHPMSPDENRKYMNATDNGGFHWRRYLPVTYYSSHSLAPLMYMTGLYPKRVIGKAVLDTPAHAKEYERIRSDIAGIMLVEMNNGALFRISGSSYLAPHENWYRLSCIEGGTELIRGHKEKLVRLAYNAWSIPEGCEEEKIYEAEFRENAEEASHCGHAGSDYFVTRAFVEAVKDRKPFFPDVYAATAMSATAIMGWRSVLEDSRQLGIPDFRKEEDRRLYENDELTPFPSEGKPNSLPYSTIPIEELLGKDAGDEN